jgi:hypothetical protein
VNESSAETDDLLPDALVSAEVLNLRSELGRARRSLKQREEALAVLNRRLLALETGQVGAEHASETYSSADERARAASLAEQLSQVTAEVEHLRWAQEEVLRLQASKMFRYTWPVRRALGGLRPK